MIHLRWLSALFIFLTLPLLDEVSAASSDVILVSTAVVAPSPGDPLLLHATFNEGELQVDRLHGDPRVSRIQRGQFDRFPPDDDRGSRVGLADTLTSGRISGGFGVQAITDLGIRATGNINPDRGSFTAWISQAPVLHEGGLLLAARSFIPGGPRAGATAWALGVGGASDSDAPRGRLFLTTQHIQCVAAEPLPETDWIFVAAVWDVNHGIKLYANGELIGSTWSDQEAEEEIFVEETTLVWPQDGFANEILQARISHGVSAGREWHPLSEGEFIHEDLVASYGEESDFFLQGDIDDRVQLRFRPFDGLQPGTYRLTVEVLQVFRGSPDIQPPQLRMGLTERGRETEHSRLDFPATDEPWWREVIMVFELHDDEKTGKEWSMNLDLNFNHSGIYRIRSVVLEKGDFSGELDMRLISYGVPWWPVLELASPTPVERFQIYGHGRNAPVYDELAFWDIPLSEESVQELMKASDWTAVSVEAEDFEPGTRSEWFGWNGAGQAIPVRPDQLAVIKEAPVERAWEDLRAAGSLVVDGNLWSLGPWFYHGYPHISPRTFHFKFFEPSQINYINLFGNLTGQFTIGGSPRAPLDGESFLELPGDQGFSSHFLSEPVVVDQISLIREHGEVSTLGFYEISGEAPSGLQPDLRLTLTPSREAGPPLPPAKLAEFLTLYPTGERDFLVGQSGAGHAFEMEIGKRRALHLVTPPMREDYPLDAVLLRLFLEGITPGSHFQVRMHDPLIPWRELGRFDFVADSQAGDSGGRYDLLLDLRETLVLEGDSLWLTLYFEEEVTLVGDGDAQNSSLVVYRADPEMARERWRLREMADWRNRFESLSEPRPWSRPFTSDDPESNWWLQAASPEYEYLHRIGLALRERFPDDREFFAWFLWVHPFMDLPEWVNEPAPTTREHPDWAELAKANLDLYHEFVDFWTRERAHENGEIGNWIGDDTVLVQDFPDMALISDPDGEYREVVRRLAEGVHGPLTIRNRPAIVNGLNSRWTDALHAYEDGINVQPMNFQLHYGDPVLFAYLLENASRYDGFLFTEARDGMRMANSEGRGRPDWSTDRSPVGGPWTRYWFLPIHPGLTLLWYNQHPELLTIFEEIAEGHLRRMQEVVDYHAEVSYGGVDFWIALYDITGDPRYLSGLMDLEATKDAGYPVFHIGGFWNRLMDPTRLRRFPVEWVDARKLYEFSREDADDRFDSLYTRELGHSSRRYERNWMEWYLTGDTKYLEEGLQALYARLKTTLPALTVAEQSGDRVSPPKQLISQMYLGGIPAARNSQFYPTYAVSYEGLSTGFAALVWKDRPEELRVSLYNFEEQPQEGIMRIWNLKPGRYSVRSGIDRTGDGRVDEWQGEATEMDLVRGDAIPLQLPSHREVIVEAELIEPGLPLAERPDPAVSHRDAVWNREEGLVLRVHNLGNVPATDVEVVVRDPDGREMARQQIERIEPPLDFHAKFVEIRFPRIVPVDENSELVVELNPGHPYPEITRRNNEALIRVQP